MRLISVLLLIICAGCSYAGSLEVSEAYYRDTNASLHLFLTNHSKESSGIL